MSLPLWSQQIRPAALDQFRLIVASAEQSEALSVVERNARRVRLELRRPVLSQSPLRGFDAWTKRRERPSFFADIRLIGEAGDQHTRATVCLHTFECAWAFIALFAALVTLSAAIRTIAAIWFAPAEHAAASVTVPLLGVAIATAILWFLCSLGGRDFRALRDAVRRVTKVSQRGEAPMRTARSTRRLT